MKITLRKFCTRTDGKLTVLASLEQNGKGDFVVLASMEQGSKDEFLVRDGLVVVDTLPPTERADAAVVYEAVRDLVMRKRKQD